jgi:Phage tail tube protein
MSAAIGTLSRFAIGPANPVTLPLQFERETFARQDEPVDGNALRGTFGHSIEVIQDGIQRVAGTVDFIPQALEWSYLLPWIMGGTPTGPVSGVTTYPFSDAALPLNFVTIDRKAQVFTYAGVAVDRATFRASRGTTLTVSLDLVGQTETPASSGTFPALTLDVTTHPLLFTQLVLSINSTSVQCFDFELTINHHIDRDRFLNTLNLTAVNQLDRTCEFRTNLPYGDQVALYTAMSAGPGAVAMSATFTNGGSVLTMSSPAVSVPKKTPTVPGRQEIRLPWGGMLAKSGSTNELTIGLNPGP